MKNQYSCLLLFGYFFLPLVLSSCNLSPNASPNVLTTAWQACDLVTGSQTGHPFGGKAVLVWNVHPEMDYDFDNKTNHYEQMGQMWLTNAQYFILGDYDKTEYYFKDNVSDYFTLNLDEAGAILCLSVKYKDVGTCTYDNGFSIKSAVAEANVKLVSWPDKKLISTTSAVTSSPDGGCQSFINTQQLGDHIVRMNNIDIWEWFIEYTNKN